MTSSAPYQPDSSRNSEEAQKRRRILQAFGDFRSFCGLLKLQPKEGGGRIPFVLSPVQRAYNSARTSRDNVLKARQVHMTTIECARDLWWFLIKQGARVVIVVQSTTDQAPLKDVSYKIRIFLDSLRALGIELSLGQESMSEWTLPSRDSTLRIIQAGASEVSASKKGRAGTVNRLHISEAAFFEYADDTFNALTQSVPQTGSEIVIETTPNGGAGWFFEHWTAAASGNSTYKNHFFPWYSHGEYRIALEAGETFTPETDLEKTLLGKGVTPEQLKWYRWKLRDKGGNSALVSQEYPSDPTSCFLQSGRNFFDTAVVQRLALHCVDAPVTQVIRESGAHGQFVNDREVPALRVWHQPEPDHLYVVAADPSEGTEGDAAASVVLERVTGRHMATLWGQFKPWELAKYSVALAKKYNWATLACERNNHGSAFLRAADAEYNYRSRIFEDRDGKPGWLTHEATRMPMLEALEKAIREGHCRTLDRFIVSELGTFIINPKGKPEAQRGAHDDLVMALGIGWDVICRPPPRPFEMTGLVA